MKHILPRGIVAALLLALAGCEPAPPAAPAANESTQANEATTPAPPVAPAVAAPIAPSAPAAPAAPLSPAPPEGATLQALTLGDRACYLTFAAPDGTTREEMGRMELCELTALVGQPVLPAYAEEQVAAESCQGDPECSATETVRLVTELQPQR